MGNYVENNLKYQFILKIIYNKHHSIFVLRYQLIA